MRLVLEQIETNVLVLHRLAVSLIMGATLIYLPLTLASIGRRWDEGG